MDNSIVYPNFNRLKILTRWAGILGVLQSLIWLGLSIVGIIYYQTSVVDYQNDEANYSTITEITFYKLYFNGDGNKNLPNIDYQIINNETTLNPEQINIWIWVYLVSSVFWLISSMSLIIQIPKAHLRGINTLLYIWIFITLYTSGMDLALSIIFGFDFNNFNNKSNDIDVANNSKIIDGVILLAAKISSISMMIMAAKGFILWLINFGFMAYFFKETFVIGESVTEDRHRGFMSDTQSITNRSPIRAYDANNVQNPNHSLKLNTAPIERASRMSNAVLEDRNMSGGHYNRSFSSFEQYPKNEPTFPEPDYTPPMTRSNQFIIPPLRPVGSQPLKNKRYF